MSPELIGLVAIIGTTITGILTTLFTSRCSNIRLCCGFIECDREIKHTKEDLEYEKAKKELEEDQRKFDEEKKKDLEQKKKLEEDQIN